jgi:small-conductance mechanosensitive channel
MADWLLPTNLIEEYLAVEGLASVVRSLVILLGGIPLFFFLSRQAQKFVSRRYSAQQAMIAAKIIKYSGIVLVTLMVFNQLGFKLAPLLGAAGIVGIAIGFASQTSVSNIISGLFLIAEEPFVVGDVISIGDTTGQVLSVDILSVKLRTFDNKFVRIPNESIIKGQVTNITHFPIRRADIEISVAYKENLEKVRHVLLELAEKNPLCLQEPEPLVILKGFGNSSIDFNFAVWAQKTDFLKLRNSLQEEIKKKFDQEGIEIPFPHISLYTGEASKPFPVSIVDSKK